MSVAASSFGENITPFTGISGKGSANRILSPVERAESLLTWARAAAAHNIEKLKPIDIVLLLSSFVFPAHVAHEFARDLLAEYGSVGTIIAQAEEKLSQEDPPHRAFWELCQIVTAAMRDTLKEPIINNFHFATWKDLTNYLRLALGNEKEECFRILFLDSRNALIKDELHNKGSNNYVQVYPQKIVKRTLELQAASIIFVHNHPSGNPYPSETDIDMTQELETVLRLLGIDLYDHVIVSRSRCSSMRKLGYIGVGRK